MRWLPIKGFEGLYNVSEFGDVFSIRTNKLLKAHKDKDGYLQLKLSVEGKQYHKRVAKIVAETFIENPECKYTVNHKDKNILNNHFTNLEWMTYSENTRHRHEVDPIMTEERLNTIKKDIDEGLNREDIIKKYNVSSSTLAKYFKGYSLNKAGRKDTPIEIQQRVKELFNLGYKKTEIAKELGLHRQTVSKYCH